MKIFNLLLLTLITLPAFANFDHSHQNFNNILKQNVYLEEGSSSVDYKNLKKNNYHELKEYIKILSSVSKEDFNLWSQTQQLSFLINAYNANTLWMIIKNYPIKSPKDIKLAGGSLWDIKFIKILDQKITLNDLENNLIRKNYPKEHQIHFLVNCAAKSCPAIQPVAISEKNIKEIMLKTETNFISNTSVYSKEKNTLQVAKIFEWYQEDFTKKIDNKNLVSYFKKFFPQLNDQTKITFLEYNWSLNSNTL